MSDAARMEGLVERVERLEGEVRFQGESLKELYARIPGSGSASESRPGIEPVAGRDDSPPVTSPGSVTTAGVYGEDRFEEQAKWFRERFSDVLRAEWLFTRGGILLLLLGVAFLFKLSVDEGWITPPIRVALGVGLGVALIGLGLRIYARRTTVGQVLLGGGIASLYISGFAAFTLFSLVPAYVAYPYMISVTLASFVLALRQNSATLSVIGTAGGLATPFLLYSDDGRAIQLTLYTLLVFSGAMAVYLYRGWKSLASVATSGALLVFLAGGWSLPFEMNGISAERVVLVGGIVFCWLASWFAPIVQSYRSGVESPREAHVGLYLASAVSLPLVAFSLVRFVVEIDFPAPGFVWLGMAAGYALLWYALRRSDGFMDGRVVYVQAVVATILAVLATIELLSGWGLVLVLAVEAAALHLLSTRNRDVLARIAGHVLFSVLAIWLVFDVGERTQTYLPQDDTAAIWIVWLAVLGLAMVSSFLLDSMGSVVYRVGAHVGLLAWILAVLAPLDNSGVWTTVAWGLCGMALVVGALRFDSRVVFRIGLGTLLLVVAKLFLVDLFWVEALWRVALFTGFGGLFIALGYAVQAIWRPTGSSDRPEPTRSVGS